MRFFVFLLALSLVGLVSCKKEEPIIQDENFIKGEITVGDKWVEIKIPNQKKGISAIYGSIDDTLVIANYYQIFFTVDKGKTWEKATESSLGIFGFYEYKNELIAFTGLVTNQNGSFARNPSLFSNDHGKTWSNKGLYSYEEYENIGVDYKRIVSSSDREIYLKSNTSFEVNPISSNLVFPDFLVENESNTERIIFFPYNKQIESLYEDAEDRLYVGCNGTIFEWEVTNWNNQTNTGERSYPKYEKKASLYYSK